MMLQGDCMMSLCKYYLAETKVKVAEIALPGMPSTIPAKYAAGLCQPQPCQTMYKKKVAGNRQRTLPK